MITGELKNRIDKLWETFWTGGITNPLDVIEQITYLMFIRDLDDLDNLRSRESMMFRVSSTSAPVSFASLFPEEKELCRWSRFRDLTPEKMYDVVQNQVFPFIKNLHADRNSAYSKYMGDAIFKVPTPQLLSTIVAIMDDIDWKNKDIRGDVYEYLLSKIATAGVNGQFRTPRHIIRMMVELIDPRPGEMVCDPACGTAGFLVACGDYMKEKYHDEIFYDREKKEHYNTKAFYGYDMDRTMLRIGAMNMMTHGIEAPHIQYRDSLSDQNEDSDLYDVILANPPFKGSLAADIVSKSLSAAVKTKKTELLFVALFLRMLRKGGRCAAIVPDGVLFSSSNAHRTIRKTIIEDNQLEAVISMPSGVFKPYAGVSTAVLLFRKTEFGNTDKVWFYDMQADGYSLDDKRAPVAENDIPDIVARFKNREAEKDRTRSEKSFFVPKLEILENEYDLSINKYKKIEYKPVEYPPTQKILADLSELEKEISKGLEDLKEMLK